MPPSDGPERGRVDRDDRVEADVGIGEVASPARARPPARAYATAPWSASRCKRAPTTRHSGPTLAMLCTSLRSRGEEYVAWPRHDHRLRRGQGDRDPARAPVGEPARRAGATTRRARTSNSTALDAPDRRQRPPDARQPARRPRSRSSAADEHATRRATRLRRASRQAAPRSRSRTPLTVDARLDADRGLSITTEVRPTERRAVPISFGWHPYVTLPDGGRADLGAALARVRAHRGRRRASIPTGVRTPQPRRPRSRSAAARSTTTTRSAPTARSRCRGAGRTLTLAASTTAYPFAQLFVPPGRQTRSRSSR